MNISLDPALLEALKSLAAKLGTTFEYLLRLARQRVLTDIVCNGIAVFIGIVAIITCAVVVRYAYRREHDKDGDYFEGFPYYAACGIVGIIAIYAIFTYGAYLLKYLLNTEYYALWYVLNMVK